MRTARATPGWSWLPDTARLDRAAVTAAVAVVGERGKHEDAGRAHGVRRPGDELLRAVTVPAHLVLDQQNRGDRAGHELVQRPGVHRSFGPREPGRDARRAGHGQVGRQTGDHSGQRPLERIRHEPDASARTLLQPPRS